MSASSKATTSARATVDVVVSEGLRRQYRDQDRGGNRAADRRVSARRDVAHLARQDRLSAGARGVPDAARQDGPAQGEWRRVPRPQRHRHQEPWRNRRGRLCGRGRRRLRHGPLRTAQQDQRNARPPRQRGGAASKVGEPLRDRHTFRRSRLRQLSAAAHPHQCRAVADGRHIRRMDRAAHRHPRAPHRGGRRNHLRSRRSRRRAPRSPHAAGRCAVDRSDRGRDLDAGQHLSGERRRGPGRRSASITARRSTCRRCARASSTPWRPPTGC